MNDAAVRAIIERFGVIDMWITTASGQREHYRVDHVTKRLVKAELMPEGSEIYLNSVRASGVRDER